MQTNKILISKRFFKSFLLKFKPVFFISAFLIFLPSFTFGQTNLSISFKKTEIASFKWGQEEREVGILKRERANIYRGIDQGGKKDNYYWSRFLRIDGNDNIYFLDGWNKRIFIISADGTSIRTVNTKKTGGLATVDALGNIYGAYYKKGESLGFILTRPDGTQTVYKNFHLNFEENGVVYDLENNRSLTIMDNGNNPEKLPPHLMTIKGEVDLQNNSPDSFTIYTEKINKHLKKINRYVSTNKIQIKFEDKKDIRAFGELIGIDDDGNSYFLCSYTAGGSSDPWKEAYIVVYSESGQKLSEIELDLDYFNKQISSNELALDVYGNVFQMLASEDGIHILKWSKK